MDHHRRQSKDSLSYSNLFNLEPLMNFQLPQPDDDFDYYGNSSQDESRGSQGGVAGNGMMSDRELSSVKKRRRSQNSDYEEDDSYYPTHITEKYRSMLGEHIQKCKRRFKDSSSSPAPMHMGIPVPKGNKGSKSRKLANENRGGFYEMETTSEWLNDAIAQKPGNYHDADFSPQSTVDRFVFFFWLSL